MTKLEQGYQEIVELVRSVLTHMKDQTDRSDRLMNMMEGLPEAIRSLPETNRQQSRVLESIEVHLGHQGATSRKLSDALDSLASATHNHDESLHVLQTQMTAGQENDEQIVDSFKTLNTTLGTLSESSQASTDVLRGLARHSEHTEHVVRDLFNRSQNRMAILSMASMALAVVALIVAGYVAMPDGPWWPSARSSTGLEMHSATVVPSVETDDLTAPVHEPSEEASAELATPSEIATALDEVENAPTKIWPVPDAASIPATDSSDLGSDDPPATPDSAASLDTIDDFPRQFLPDRLMAKQSIDVTTMTALTPADEPVEPGN